MVFQEKQLGQLRPADTIAASIYSPAASTTTVVKNIIICNIPESLIKIYEIIASI